MESFKAESFKPLARAGYLLALAMVVFPLADTIMPLLPLHFSDQRWRWVAAGQISNILTVPLIGLLIAMAMAILTDARRTRRVMGIICGLFALVLLALLGAFIFDFSHVGALVAANLQHGMHVASTMAIIKYVLALIMLVLLCLAGFAGPNVQERPEPARVPVPPPAPLVGATRVGTIGTN